MAFNELRAIATFAKAAELGSLRQAAASQGITPQAASQALTQLEKHLGVRLLHRTTRRLSLTEEGEQFLHAAQPGLASLHRALHGARRGQEAIAGPLRLTAPRSIMLPVLWPAVQAFAQAHPDIELDVQLSDRIGNWVEDRVDVGFRAGSAPDGGVVARRLLPLPLVVCATPSYIARHGAPQSIDDLAHHRCSNFRHSGTGKVMPWEFRVGDEIVSRLLPSAFCANDVELERNAVLAGLAVGQFIGVDAAPLVRTGHLVPLLTEHVTDHQHLYLYYGSRAAQPARVRRFIDWMVEHVAGNTEFFFQPGELATKAPAGRKRARPARQ